MQIAHVIQIGKSRIGSMAACYDKFQQPHNMARVTLPIACAINGDYALPLLVMLTSLQEHLRPSHQLLLYLVHQGVSEEVLASISRLVEIHSIVPTPDSVAALPRHPRFPPEAAYPLLLPDLLPKTLDRILFLDADLLVLDGNPLEDIHNTKRIAAVIAEGRLLDRKMFDGMIGTAAVTAPSKPTQ